MSDREGRLLLEAICANPDDNTARLVYADWLAEHGNEARAEFIRVQVERSALPEWDAQRVRLFARECVLLKQHEAQWRAELPTIKYVSWGEFRRGFVAQAAFSTFTTFRSHLATCRAAAPIEAVEVRWPRGTDRGEEMEPLPGLREMTITSRFVHVSDIDRITDSPLLSTVRTLNVHRAALGIDGFRRLVRSPHFQNLTALRAPFNAVGNGALGAISAVDTLPALTELDLSETGNYGRYNEDPIITADGASVLAEWPGLARFRALALSGNDLRQGGLRALLRSPHIGGLKQLTLRDNMFTGPAIAEFARANPALQLDVLDLGENVLEDSGAGHLVGAPCLRELKVLHLPRCELGTKAVNALAKAPFLRDLRVLDIGQNNIGTKGLSALLGAKPAALHTLSVVGSDLGDAGAVKLAESAASDTLLELDLTWNNLRAKATQALAASKHLRNLLILKLTQNMMPQRAADALAKSKLGKRLAILELPPPPALPDDPIPF